MAEVVDAARPADVTVNCANTTYQGGDSPTWNRGFSILQSTADSHIETMDTDGSVGDPSFTSQTGYPVIDMSLFWYGSTPQTLR